MKEVGESGFVNGCVVIRGMGYVDCYEGYPTKGEQVTLSVTDTDARMVMLGYWPLLRVLFSALPRMVWAAAKRRLI